MTTNDQITSYWKFVAKKTKPLQGLLYKGFVSVHRLPLRSSRHWRVLSFGGTSRTSHRFALLN